MPLDPARLRFRPELVADSAYLAPGARIIGEVSIGPAASIWFNAVVRGDSERIEIGAGTNVQDGCVLHADPGKPCILGQRVTLGHGAIVHGATVEDDVLIGMRAVVMNGARIGAGSIVGVGAIVLENTDIPPGSIVVGSPGKVIRQATDRDREKIRHAADHYIEAAKAYKLASRT
jgi:carbonic anhydrase/acetyltransferase-like protein (isoleucine patch superfamily)